jgi:non-heme Fe2+,alpha-ketoglutarate-dependent halogenase
MSYGIDNFNTNGFAYPLKLSRKFTDKELKEEYYNFQNQCKEKLNYYVSLKPNLLSTFFDELAFDKNIISSVQKLIGPDIYIWSSAFFPKEPGEGKIVSFHQDNPYWQLTSNNVVSAWIALTNSTEKSGALSVVPKSHKNGVINKLDVDNPRESYLEGKKTTPDKDLLSYKQNLDNFILQNPPICLNLQPGEFSIHHVNTVHGSGINKTDQPRIGFAIRYVSSDTKHIIEKNGDSAIHVCGKKNSYFSNEPRPKKSFSNLAIETHISSMKSAGAFGNKKYTKN